MIWIDRLKLLNFCFRSKLILKKDKVVVRESLISWLFFGLYICAFIFIPIGCVIFFVFHVSPLKWVKYVIIGFLVALLTVIKSAVHSPLEIDFDHRFIIIRNFMNYEANEPVGKEIKIDFDDIASIEVKGLGVHLINFQFTSFTIKTKKIYGGMMLDLTKGRNAITISLNLMTYQSRKELHAAIGRLKSELDLQ